MGDAITIDHTLTIPETRGDSGVESTIAKLKELFAKVVSKKVEGILEQHGTDEQRDENSAPIIRVFTDTTTNHFIQKLSSGGEVTNSDLSELLGHLENPTNYNSEGDILQQTEETKRVTLFISILVSDVLTKLHLKITINPSKPGKVVLKTIPLRDRR